MFLLHSTTGSEDVQEEFVRGEVMVLPWKGNVLVLVSHHHSTVQLYKEEMEMLIQKKRGRE